MVFVSFGLFDFFF